MSDILCKGSIALGSGCMSCQRCFDDMSRLKDLGYRMVSQEMRSAAMKDAQKVCDLAAENDRLSRLIGIRDRFIVDQGLWPVFCDTLPSTIEERGTRDEVEATD